jgi:hypothetical protein
MPCSPPGYPAGTSARPSTSCRIFRGANPGMCMSYFTLHCDDWFRVRNVTPIEFQKSRRCGESECPLASESSRVNPRGTQIPTSSPGLAAGASFLVGRCWCGDLGTIPACCRRILKFRRVARIFRRSSAAVATSSLGPERSICNNRHRSPDRRPWLRSSLSQSPAWWCPALETCMTVSR